MNYPEQELVRRSKSGDIEAFEKLIQFYEKRIFNIALSMTGNYEDASDIAQEVCIKIFKNIGRFKENSSFSTWVYKITSNTCIDELRKRNQTISISTVYDCGKEFEIQIVDHGKGPDEVLESKEITRLVRSCITKLTPEYRIVIILRDIYGYSYEEISKILCLNLGTVKSRLNRARKLLKDIINKRNILRSNSSK